MRKGIILSLASLSLCLVSCTEEKQKTVPPTYDYSYFNGICALSGEFNNGVDVGLTNEWTASKAKALGAKSCRIWIAMSGLFSVGEEDDLHLNQIYYSVMKDHVEKLQEAGVENFLLMFTAFVYPTGYVPTTGYVVPNPREEYDFYLRFLKMNAEAAGKIKELFPEIRNFEPGNEPDFACPGCIHKNGFIHGGGMNVNSDFIYNDDDKISILNDLCWYVRKAVTSVDPNAKVVYPGLTNQATVPDFVDLIYKKIESQTLPAGQEFSDNNPDNYFDILNWHPYPTQIDTSFNIKWDEWAEYNKSIYDVVKRHGDEGKEVYFSELGWTDWGTDNDAEKEKIASNYSSAFKTIREEMPWVTAVFAFRLTNLKYQMLDTTGGEENFGLFYHPEDEFHHGEPKPAAHAVAKAFNGQDYDLEEHL